MRKRSVVVVVGGVLATAGAIWWLNSADPDYSRACVDQETEVRVEDEDCEDEHSPGGARWFYSGYSHSVPPVGTKMNMTQGSFTKPSGSISTVSRGGFGGRASSSGS